MMEIRDGKIIRYLTPMPGESLESFLAVLSDFRKIGVEVDGIYNGIQFSNMGEESVASSYKKAVDFYGGELRKGAERERREIICGISRDQVKMFTAINKENKHLTTDEIMTFLLAYGHIVKPYNGTPIPTDLAHELYDILKNVGYEQIEIEKAYSVTDEAKKGYTTRVVNETPISLPESEADIANATPEELATYAIRNAMLQLGKYELDWRLSEFACEYRKKKTKLSNNLSYQKTHKE